MKKSIKILALLIVLVISVMAFVACDTEFPFFDNSGNGSTSGSGSGSGSGSDTGTGNGSTSGSGSQGKEGYYELDVYAINDLHGKFEDTDSQPGVDEMTTYLKQMASEKNTIFLSAGDMWQGSCESGLTKGNIITDWMNDLGFAAMTLGNHEFDWGVQAIKSNIELAEFPILAINVYDRETSQRLEGCEASTVVDKGDVKIGIIGAIGDCYSSIEGSKTAGVYFKTDSDLTKLVKEEATRLRDEEGVDFVIYSIHDGYEDSFSSEQYKSGDLSNEKGVYYDKTLSDGYVDLVFEGHSHQNYIIKDGYGVYHLQNGGDNSKGISHAQVLFNLNDGTARVREKNKITHSVYKNMTGDAIVGTLMEKYDDLVGTMHDPIEKNGSKRSSSVLAQTVARLYYTKGLEKWGSDSRYSGKIVLGGGSINVRSPYNLYSGDITYAKLYMLFPFDNEIVLCSISGSKLKSRFIENGEYVTHGYNNQNISDNVTYYIVTDTWNSSYASNGLTVIDYYGDCIYARDLLAEYAKTGAFA